MQARALPKNHRGELKYIVIKNELNIQEMCSLFYIEIQFMTYI